MREYLERVNNIRNSEKYSLNPPLPVNDLRLELSNTCNHSCIFCAHRKMTRPKKQMEDGFIRRILREAYDAGFRGLGYYASGEPFMTKRLAEYVKLAKDIGYDYVYIDTNGGAVEFDRIREVIDAGLDSIKFSINGTNAENYKLIHGRDDFERVTDNLKKTYRYKQTLERKLNVFVSFAVTKYTEKDLDDFISEFSKYSDDIITANVIDMGGYVPEVRKFLRNSNKTDFSDGMTVPCYTLWNTFIVTCEGYVTACCADFQNYFAYADLNKETIWDAWTNPYITQLRKDHLEGKIKGTPCETCIGGPQFEWRPLREDLCTRFDADAMFDITDASRRIKDYENRSLLKSLHFDEPVLDYAKKTVDIIREYEHIVLFGAGITGEKVKKYLDQNGILVEYFIDNNPNKQGKRLEGIEILSEKAVLERIPSATIVVSCDAFMEITDQLVRDGFNKEHIVYFEPDWLNTPEGHGEYIRQHIDDFRMTYNMLEDEKSRDVFVALLNYKITHNLQYITNKADVLPYFDSDLVRLGDDCIFLDCGAFIGDTLGDFISYTKGRYGKVICFEPNPENVIELKKNIANRNIKNVDVFERGLSDKKQRLCFSGSSEGGRISQEGFAIECDTIDNLCFDNVSKVDMIKMDIEGSEYYALLGAKKIIQRDKPVLAVCVYHKEDDFFKLTRLIKELNPNYKLYFRQYELSGEETVCIAVDSKQEK